MEDFEMKIREGFVSNSSSCSFILKVRKKDSPYSLQDIKEYFGVDTGDVNEDNAIITSLFLLMNCKDEPPIPDMWESLDKEKILDTLDWASYWSENCNRGEEYKEEAKLISESAKDIKNSLEDPEYEIIGAEFSDCEPPFILTNSMGYNRQSNFKKNILVENNH